MDRRVRAQKHGDLCEGIYEKEVESAEEAHTKESANPMTSSDEESDGDQVCWTKEELEEHFKFGPQFFGGDNPEEREKAEVNASVLSSLLLLPVGDRFELELLSWEYLWDKIYAMLLIALLS